MIVIVPGHTYDLANKENGHQRLQFFKDLPHSEEKVDGVLCQEVLRALIDRVLELNSQKPCHENIDIINGLRHILILFETRAARGTMEKCYSRIGVNVEELPVNKNGHIFILPHDKR